jgi:hypothetical protein
MRGLEVLDSGLGESRGDTVADVLAAAGAIRPDAPTRRGDPHGANFQSRERALKELVDTGADAPPAKHVSDLPRLRGAFGDHWTLCVTGLNDLSSSCSRGSGDSTGRAERSCGCENREGSTFEIRELTFGEIHERKS